MHRWSLEQWKDKYLNFNYLVWETRYMGSVTGKLIKNQRRMKQVVGREILWMVSHLTMYCKHVSGEFFERYFCLSSIEKQWLTWLGVSGGFIIFTVIVFQ